jgi:hypothetical protein
MRLLLPALVLSWSLVAIAAAAAQAERFAAGVFLVEVYAFVLLDHRPYSVVLAPPFHLALLLTAVAGNTPVTAGVVGGIGAVCSGAAFVHQWRHNL